jgi:hypothetical protein
MAACQAASIFVVAPEDTTNIEFQLLKSKILEFPDCVLVQGYYQFLEYRCKALGISRSSSKRYYCFRNCPEFEYNFYIQNIKVRGRAFVRIGRASDDCDGFKVKVSEEDIISAVQNKCFNHVSVDKEDRKYLEMLSITTIGCMFAKRMSNVSSVDLQTMMKRYQHCVIVPGSVKDVHDRSEELEIDASRGNRNKFAITGPFLFFFDEFQYRGKAYLRFVKTTIMFYSDFFCTSDFFISFNG